MTERGTFVCDVCGGTFPLSGDQAAVAAEAKELWGIEDIHAPGVRVVCDACFERGKPAALAEKAADDLARELLRRRPGAP